MKNKHNDSTKAFEIDNSANVKDNKKGFRIVIENLDTGERSRGFSHESHNRGF